MCWEHDAVRQMAQVQVRRNRSQALLLLTRAYSSGFNWHTVPAVCRSKYACSLKGRSSRYQKQKILLFHLLTALCDHYVLALVLQQVFSNSTAHKCPHSFSRQQAHYFRKSSHNTFPQDFPIVSGPQSCVHCAFHVNLRHFLMDTRTSSRNKTATFHPPRFSFQPPSSSLYC